MLRANPPHPGNRCALRLLGSIGMERNGEAIASHLPKKGVALLAYLALDPGVPQSRQKLADILWPDLPEEASRSNLRQVLLGVKRLLDAPGGGVASLVADRHTISFSPSCPFDFDVTSFLAPLPDCPQEPCPADCPACLAQQEALADLYRGEFMDGFALEGCPEFEEWLEVRREALRQRALFLLERIANCWEAQGSYGRALGFAMRFHKLASWNDGGLRRVMRLAALSGQRGFALSLYDSFRRSLRLELGVSPEKDTRLLAQRIQREELKPDRLAPKPDSAGAESPSRALERRQVTILSCQFTPLEARDPEETMALLHGPQARCMEIVRSFNGHVIRAGGGGLLAYFGYPTAKEDAARLAIRAALTVASEAFPGLVWRAGVHTGLILTEGDPELPDVMGLASGLAVGLRNLAAGGEVLLSAETRQLVAGYFDCSGVGERSLPGAPQPVSCFRVLGPSGARDRLEAAASLAPLVGRHRERVFLAQTWDAVKRGEGRALLLRGEAGIGKSRLVHHLRQSLGDPSLCTILLLHCLPESSQSPFQPIIDLLGAQLGFSPADSAEGRFAKLARAMTGGEGGRGDELVPLIAEMLSLPLMSPYRATGFSAQQRRHRAMTVLFEQLQRLAAKKPVLLVVEDLHWIDPSSLELLMRLVDGGGPGSVLVLLTARSEFQSPWPSSLVPQMNLPPLEPPDISTLVEAVAPHLKPALRNHIVARADGVPLFAEELARISRPEEDALIPASLQDLLAARLDALAKDRVIAQLAATIGRDFSIKLLVELSLLDPGEVAEALGRLEDSGLISASASGSWRFRHALFQEATYGSQARAERQSTHRRIARSLEERFPEFVRRRPEVLAQHWEVAGEADRAIACRLQAGRRAQLQCAYQEALGHFNAGLALLPRLPEDQAKIQRELPLQVGRGAAAYALEGYASATGAAAYRRAVDLSARVEGTPEAFRALWGLWAGNSSHFDWGHSQGLARRLLQMAQVDKDPVRRQQAHFAMGNIQFWRGAFKDSRRHLERAMALYTPRHHEALVTGYGENAYATSGGYLGWTLCQLGFPEQAMAAGRRAVAEARRVGHPFSLGYALTFFTVLHRMVREPAATLQLAEETMQLGVTHGFPLWQVGAGLKHGWARVMLGDPGGLAEMQACVDAVRTLMSGILLIFLETQADGLRQAGKPEEALAVIGEAQELVARLDDHHVEAELHRLQGDCLLELSAENGAAAERCFQQALTVSRRQHALLSELRAAVALARLCALPAGRPARVATCWPRLITASPKVFLSPTSARRGNCSMP